jgi:replicative DNA helicase
VEEVSIVLPIRQALTVEPPRREDPISTGLRDLDIVLEGGIRPGQVVVLASRTQIGGSVLVLTLTRAALRSGFPVAQFAHDEIALVVRRLRAAEASVPLTHLDALRATSYASWPPPTPGWRHYPCFWGSHRKTMA